MSAMCLVPRLHSAPIPGWFRGRTLEVGQIRLGGGGEGVIDPHLHSDPAQGADPQAGQNEWAQVRNFSCYPWKSSIHCGGRPSFLFTHTKKRCQTPHVGSNPTNLEEHKRQVRPRNRGRWFVCTLRGKRRGLTPHLGFDPAIGALCKCGIDHIFSYFSSLINFSIICLGPNVRDFARCNVFTFRSYFEQMPVVYNKQVTSDIYSHSNVKLIL